MIDARTGAAPPRDGALTRGRPVWALGMMTGTSMDGLDAALLKTDGETIETFGPGWEAQAWPATDAALVDALAEIAKLRTGDLRSVDTWPGWLCDLRDQVTDHHAWAMDGFQRDTTFAGHGDVWSHGGDTALGLPIGIHGQTVLHRPDEHFTLQLFAPERLRTELRHATVISDFRTGDLGNGGQGAPLAPFYHFALAKWIGATEPIAFLNLGGVANVTWVDPSKAGPGDDGALIAFDTGPANALIDDWMRAQTGAPFDRDGEAARSGTVRTQRLSSNSGAEYLSRKEPKSLDRNDFHGVLAAMEGLSAKDGAATLTAFTAECVAAGAAHLPSAPARWLVCGGGRRNPTLMQMLRAKLASPVETVEAVGLDGDLLEAQAFAYLAVRVLRGLPTSAPGTTGCSEPVCGGRITPLGGENGQRA